MNSQKDISSILISEQAIQQILPSILVDAIVLDEGYKIIAASQNVLDYIEYTNDELKNQPINYLAGEKDLQALLKTNLVAGYFNEKRARLLAKSKKWISVSLTGFYLGLISDMNGSIILKVKNLNELDVVNKQLLQKKAELEDFIYRTSHDLRGPLATIRGLVNLIRVRQDNEELDSLITMMAERTEKLDERLSQLLYLTQAERVVSIPKNIIDFSEIENEVRKMARQNAVPAFVKLHFIAPGVPLKGANEILVLALVINLLQHTLSLPMSRLYGLISIKMSTQNGSLNINVGGLGFLVNDSMKEALSRSEFIYSDILNYPQLVNYYTAQKIAEGLQSRVEIDLTNDEKQRLSVTIPLQVNLKSVKIGDRKTLETFG